MEPGETLEDAVRREVREEVGLVVGDVEFRGSQPWPFPHQLMVGFGARYVSGDITLDENEIAEAYWFTADEAPKFPTNMSIASRLIDGWRTRVLPLMVVWVTVSWNLRDRSGAPRQPTP